MKKCKGYIALSTVLIICSVTIAITLTVTFLAIGELQSTFALNQGEITLQQVEGCTEDALLKARASNLYGGGTINQPGGSCTVAVSKSGNIWTMTVSNTDGQFKRTVETIFEKTSRNLKLLSWKEI